MTGPECSARPDMNAADRMVDQFIGKRWAPNAEGPDAFDCWSLARTAARVLFGLHFPVMPYAAHTPADVARSAAAYLDRTRWVERASATRGAILALCQFDDTVRHVALCLDTSRCLHIAGATRSCVLPVRRLVATYPRARFYTWAP